MRGCARTAAWKGVEKWWRVPEIAEEGVAMLPTGGIGLGQLGVSVFRVAAVDVGGASGNYGEQLGETVGE